MKHGIPTETREVRIIGARCANQETLHDYVARKLNFPDYYGKNLSALADCLSEICVPTKITIAINGAIDHTVTYSNSVDLSKADFVFYDKESGYNLALAYPAPAEGVSEMKTYQFGQGTVWMPPMDNAAPFILIPEEGVNIQEWVKVEANFDNRSTNKSGNFAKIPTSWVLDALEEWPDADESKYYCRFPQAVNVGYNIATRTMGYSQYRNVDKAATEAIAGNAGKLVYNYAGAVSEEDTDPSGIDAEASMANGAKIVFMDTNNSSADFHQRKVPALK